jgi:hypothetical protein
MSRKMKRVLGVWCPLARSKTRIRGALVKQRSVPDRVVARLKLIELLEFARVADFFDDVITEPRKHELD